MNSEGSLRQFFDSLEKLLTIIEKVRDQKPVEEIPAIVESRLKHLEESTKLLSQITDRTMEEVGITEEQIEKIQEAETFWHNLPPSERHLIERSLLLQAELEKARRAIATQVTMAKQREKGATKSQKNVQARKKKFRQVGGDKGWKPL